MAGAFSRPGGGAQWVVALCGKSLLEEVQPHGAGQFVLLSVSIRTDHWSLSLSTLENNVDRSCILRVRTTIHWTAMPRHYSNPEPMCDTLPTRH